MVMNKLRLLLFEECDRHCAGCCNDDWDLSKLPRVDSYAGYDSISITGGEPLLEPSLVTAVVWRIRKETQCPLYLYTAKISDVDVFLDMLSEVDGICLALHDPEDVGAVNHCCFIKGGIDSRHSRNVYNASVSEALPDPGTNI